ncbi:hypothetical protein ACN9ML_30590 [Dyadobacter endophyticus]|uniref:Uncharacterized protein n=1 Tax=Dyadobacter endophyticus TaxID=1749036 RepID=A0ABQ1Z5M4_9BACT|nr:hypothetical protein [Dyadobacter endophyticus]GGH48323.1 hypothetical protein GCM10007423_49420 [Dyadobacter endophyticus]
MSRIFANFKGSTQQVSTYLKRLGEDKIGLIAEVLPRTTAPPAQSTPGSGCKKTQLKNAMELAGYRQQLRGQGLDTGKNRGIGLDM